jgi:hypothetical protein
MRIINRLDRFHKTPKGYLAFGLIELVLAYIFASIAIDSANMWTYIAALILTIGALRNLFSVFSAQYPNLTNKEKTKNAGRNR